MAPALPSSPSSCVEIEPAKEVCYIRFSRAAPSHQMMLGHTVRNELIVFDYDADDRVIGIELVGSEKPCQEGPVGAALVEHDRRTSGNKPC